MWAPFVNFVNSLIQKLLIMFFSVSGGALLPEKRRELCSFAADLSIVALVLYGSNSYDADF
jgi:hypothetical protein